MNLLYNTKQIREFEQLAIAQGVTGFEMMERAGKAAFALLQDYYTEAQKILVLCGSGNNGGDGYVVARLAQQAGLTVEVRHVGPLNKVKGEAAQALQSCKDAGVSLKPWSFKEAIEADLIVDALVGIGLQDELKPNLLKLVGTINELDSPVLAIDVPSGLLVDFGCVGGDAIYADCTVTFIGMKQGMLTAEGPDYCGEVYLEDLDLPEELFAQVSYSAMLMDLDAFEGSVPRRFQGAHKGDFGHVLVVGGAPGMLGAPKMSALAAARVGAGLVSVATHPSHAPLISADQPEIMSHGINQPEELEPLLEKANVVVIGPGLGQSPWGKSLLQTVLASALPLVMDADALNLLSYETVKRENWVLTPHPGEAARLLGQNSEEVQADRFRAVKALQQCYGGDVVLKGCGTVVGSEANLLVCSAGNPGMASGGMGDLLSGVIAGLTAQGMKQAFAVVLGVCLHASAGDLVASEQGEYGMLATDLLPNLRRLINQV